MLTRMRLENFKCWEDTGEVAFKPITGFFGPNSSGKTSLFQALLLMKQTEDVTGSGILLHFGDEKTLVDLGDLESVIYNHDMKRNLMLSLGWNSKEEFELPESIGGGAVAEDEDIGFEVKIGATNRGSGTSMSLEEMSYQFNDGRHCGIRRLSETVSGRMKYELFPAGSTVEVVRMSKFYNFPSHAMKEPIEDDLYFVLAWGMSQFLEDIYYLGPRRANPHRIYAWSGAEPVDMGRSGELVVDALISYPRDSGKWIGEDIGFADIERSAAVWLKRLGLIHSFRIDPVAEGRRIFEVKVQKTPNSPEVLLADVGFGVSQILPAIVLCFYVPTKSTIILDHPDIHLHPSAPSWPCRCVYRSMEET